MISIENGVIKLHGPAFVLEADLIIIIRSMLEENVLTKSKLDRIVKMATMSEDELKEMTKESAKSIEEMKDFLQDMLNILNRGGEDGDTFSNMFKDLDI